MAKTFMTRGLADNSSTKQPCNLKTMLHFSLGLNYNTNIYYLWNSMFCYIYSITFLTARMDH
jgi:hypothetical protein